jgi:hypothetical protein
VSLGRRAALLEAVRPPTRVSRVETFSPPKPFVHNASYSVHRDRTLAALDLAEIDLPLHEIVTAINTLSQCFTLQCCFGHFLHTLQTDPHNMQRLPAQDVGEVEYRIAYLAVCIEDAAAGHRLRALLEGVPLVAPGYVQFGSPHWFWQRQVNSYALQVEPDRLKDKDVATIGYQEALRVQEVRDLFFRRITEIVQASSVELGAA